MHLPTKAPGSRRQIVLFHSVLGLRPGVRHWADRLRSEAHTVHTPDLYDGEVFDDFSEGFRKFQSIGIPGLMSRSLASVAELPETLVYAGFSNGGACAEFLAASRPGAVGAILMHAALSIQAFGLGVWPAHVPVQVHYSKGDPRRDETAISSLRDQVHNSGSLFENYDYDQGGHLFADPGLQDFHASAAELMLERVLAFLESLTP